MKKAERLECRRKFFLCFSRIILNDKQYDDITYKIPRRDLDDSSVITIIVLRGSYYSRVSWDLREILANATKQNMLVRCRLDDMLWDIRELEKENPSPPDRLNKK